MSYNERVSEHPTRHPSAIHSPSVHLRRLFVYALFVPPCESAASQRIGPGSSLAPCAEPGWIRRYRSFGSPGRPWGETTLW